MNPSKALAVFVIVAAAACGDASGPGRTVSITSVTPDRGPLAGGTTVTITGANFEDITAVTIGGFALVNVSRLSATQITGVTAAGVATGTQEVVVTSSSRGNAHCAGCFTYTQFPGPLQLRLIMNQDSSPPVGSVLIRLEGTTLSEITSSGPAFAWAATATSPFHLILGGNLGNGIVMATITVADTQAAVLNRYHASVIQVAARRGSNYVQLNSANYFVGISKVH